MKSVTCHEIPYVCDCTGLFGAIRDMPEAIWLDSGRPTSSQGNIDIISSSADIIIETKGNISTIFDSQGTAQSTRDPFDLAHEILKPLLPIQEGYENLAFTGGLLGFFGYDLGRRFIEIPDLTAEAVDLPDMRIGRFLWALIVDHNEQLAQIIIHENCSAQLRSEVLDRLKQSKQVDCELADEFALTAEFSATLGADEYLDNIEQIKEYINSGDCYQTNFAQHFSAPYSGDEWNAYLRLRKIVAAPYSAFWKWADRAILSMSPERFLKVSKHESAEGFTVETKPIKGTIPRGKSTEEDIKNAEILRNSQKDRAENVMIVDLLRNDLSKNCIPGSVTVPTLFALETFPNVHHLVSTVIGKLSPTSSALDVLRDAFPGGSITGAPKKRAMEIIEQLEPLKRSVYCGSIGYISTNGKMDTNIAIRTVIASNQKMHCWGGGGIVADSEPSEELAESINKISIIMKTLEA